MLENVFASAFWQHQFLGNSLKQYFWALLVFLGLLLAFKILQRFVLRYFKKLAQRTKTKIDDVFLEIFQHIRPPFYFFVALYFALHLLKIGALFAKIIQVVLIFWVVYQLIITLQILINYFIKKRLAKEDKATAAAFSLLGKILKGVLWAVGLLFILSNLGVNVSSLIAGLGIGGIAVAFALQNILGDLFSSFAIFFDKPFQVGDFIVMGNYKGTVEQIGIKTTRLKSLQGEELIISNRKLTSAEIQNFGRIKERRVVLKIGVTYETPFEKLKAVPDIIKKVIKEVSGVRFDRAFFVGLGDFALLFEAVYFVKSADYIAHLKAQQKILLNLKKELEKQGIEFAYPTQTVYVKK